MNQEDNNQGNPEIGMSGDSFESTETSQNSGSKEFFNTLDQQVNGQIMDNPEATQTQPSSPEQVTYANVDTGSKTSGEQSQDGTDWQKRYTDSSREAVKWRDKFKQVEQFMPVLDAMKQDSGLVDHVRDYLKGGGKPAKSIQEELKLDEDFVFDQHEAMTNPDSDSAKLMNAHVDSMVKQRVVEMADFEKKKYAVQTQARERQNQESEFMKRNNMSEEEFKAFKAKAKNHIITLDDVNYILNKDQAASNVAQSTKQDMLNQMKNVRNMPGSASGVNSQGNSNDNPDRDVFNSILGFDSSTDNLFG
tara:strand:- start:1227 stop:2141 length:915 start_codon:yes stop_codon:yes gene_type:complete